MFVLQCEDALFVQLSLEKFVDGKKANLPYPGQKVFAGNASQNNYNLVTQKGKTEFRIPLFPMFRNSPDLFFDILAFQHLAL